MKKENEKRGRKISGKKNIEKTKSTKIQLKRDRKTSNDKKMKEKEIMRKNINAIRKRKK